MEADWFMDEDTDFQPSVAFNPAQSTSVNSDNTSRSRVSPYSNHVCYLCSAAFVLVCRLEHHLALVHGEKLHAVVPGSSTPDGRNIGNNSNPRKDSDSNTKPDNSSDDGKLKRGGPHLCSICKKVFPRPSHLQRHMLIHDHLKPYACESCGKCFTQMSHLTRHQLVHSLVRPFKCPHCDSTFKDSSAVAMHVFSVHQRAGRKEGDRRWVCDDCGATFCRAGALTIHRRIHTGGKPYSCSECDDRFAEVTSLREHRRTHRLEEKNKKKRKKYEDDSD